MFREEIEKKLDKLQEPPPVKFVKPLPKPIDPGRKKRGGKRVRKMKERYAITEFRKHANRMNFADVRIKEVVAYFCEAHRGDQRPWPWWKTSVFVRLPKLSITGRVLGKDGWPTFLPVRHCCWDPKERGEGERYDYSFLGNISDKLETLEQACPIGCKYLLNFWDPSNSRARDWLRC